MPPPLFRVAGTAFKIPMKPRRLYLAGGFKWELGGSLREQGQDDVIIRGRIIALPNVSFPSLRLNIPWFHPMISAASAASSR